mmetsp:Transcript_53972/g.115240  ORF Transcript_53972/g.115240 Transcript_53972/m.115240 type:complete len:266 (+) Transcript_53972:130-927(+)
MPAAPRHTKKKTWLLLLAFAAVFLPSTTGATLIASRFERVPGYLGEVAPNGTVSVGSLSNGHWWDTGQVLSYNLSGLEPGCWANSKVTLPSNACTIAIHEGSTCSKEALGGHAWNSSWCYVDPWKTVFYVSDPADGRARASGVEVISGIATNSLSGKLLVVVDSAGHPAACAVLRPVQESSLPTWLFTQNLSWVLVPALLGLALCCCTDTWTPVDSTGQQAHLTGASSRHLPSDSSGSQDDSDEGEDDEEEEDDELDEGEDEEEG